MARGEILRVGEWLNLPTLIKVMEEVALSFKAYPGIATYVESRLLSFSETAAITGAKDHVDETLAALGAPDTLSQVVLRSVLLYKASTVRQQEAPTYQPSWGYPALELHPTKQAMERPKRFRSEMLKLLAMNKKFEGYSRESAVYPKSMLIAAVVDAYEPAPVSSRASSEVPEPKAFERHDQCDNLTDRYQVWTDRLTPGSTQGSSEGEVCYDW
ncbi:hypothetical protein FACUT_12681 [Fusarium acutatum]|uniref:Uncharacterized protein n=1 Tax=Fusarium acutatum TaxID=78861 RepID=A0A8H4NBJ7_9HYPO|nr:hypothetical protein FACUT_12681 [Fusarium acutatum]